MSVLRVLDRSGDTEKQWSVDDAESIQQAKELFDSLRTKGFAAYSTPPGGGERAEILRDFDPAANEIVLFAAIAGG